MAKQKNKRTESGTTPREFVASSRFDHRLASADLRASAAHAEMLARQGIISRTDTNKIARALKALLARVERGGRLPRAEDIHYAIEKAVIAVAGSVGGKLHTARSRNDQVVTAFRLHLREQIERLSNKLAGLVGAFVQQAERNIRAVMPGYTHFQPGQPVLVSHHLLAYAWMFLRDIDRLADVRRRMNVLPLGAAALAGTTFPIDRLWVARRLGFSGVAENSIDAVSDRDFLADFLSAAALIMAHLSRLCEELIVWSNPSFGFVTVADAFTTGSSIMPQKRNPDVAEIIRGKTGRVYGDLLALLTILKAQPLAYNRDFQEDKPPIFDAVDTVGSSLDVAIPMVQTLRFGFQRMRDACRLGYLLATDVADALVRRGLPFRQAHGVVARVVKYAQDRDLPLEDVPVSVLKTYSPLFGSWVRGVLVVEKAVAARTSRGGTAPASVQRQIGQLKRRLRSLKKRS